MLEINQIYQGDSAELLKKIDEGIIDLTVTSPPYDNLRDYKGYSFDFETIAKELYRVTKKGGVVVWVVGDATINGSETGTSFRQALFFMECGFYLHDTMIFQKSGYSFPEFNRYNQIFEYMFVLSKGKPKTFNGIADVKNVYSGSKIARITGDRQADGSFKPNSAYRNHPNKTIKEYGVRCNIWRYIVGMGNTTTEKYAFEHPAMFPEALVKDHILSWSNQGDLVLDPFVGSGTTCKIAKLQGRKFIGIDISEEYCQIARKRIRQESLLSLVDKQDGGNGDSSH